MSAPGIAGRNRLLLWLDPSRGGRSFLRQQSAVELAAQYHGQHMPLTYTIYNYIHILSVFTLLVGLEKVGHAEIITTVDQPAIRVLGNA
jgi:hypothetical protein